MDFTSDGATWVSPEVFERLRNDRPNTTPLFDQDPVSVALKSRIEDIFEHEADVFPVITGSASNALALCALTPPYGSILSHWDAHIQTDECGAPEMFTGGSKLVGLPGEHGKIDPIALQTTLAHSRFGVTHSVQPTVLSLTQTTEAGTIYTIDELKRLTAIAKNSGLGVHMDGARLAYAVAGLGCKPAEITWRAGVDILCLGATKNGALAAEAIIVFDRRYSEKLRYMRKRSGHFVAKTRLLAIQLDAYLDNDLWLRNARHANALAERLGACVASHSEIMLVHPVEANELFLVMPDSLLEAMRSGGVQLYADWRTDPVRHHRMVTSYVTQPTDIDAVIGIIEKWSAARGASRQA